jgi:endonuclease/exonuclease/phosphatase family metal-dependent hydrolase
VPAHSIRRAPLTWSTGSTRQPPIDAPFLLLQMNLCNSGMARSCYSFGRSIDEAVQRIHRYAPDLVTVQEVCHNDVFAAHGWGPLAQAMADLYGPANVVAEFMPAGDRSITKAYQCLDGQPYGIALIYRGTAGVAHYGWYTHQDSSGEVRAWVCATVIKARLTACTTHLSTEPAVAVEQCHELESTVKSQWTTPEMIVSGDFNLRAKSGGWDVQGCTPPGYARRDDNSLQQAFFSGPMRWVEGGYQTMRFTDHPMLYEVFRP